MAHPGRLDFSEHFSVIKCQREDYCSRCNEMIPRGKIKVSFKGKFFHKQCLEDGFAGSVIVNTERMKVEPNE